MRASAYGQVWCNYRRHQRATRSTDLRNRCRKQAGKGIEDTLIQIRSRIRARVQQERGCCRQASVRDGRVNGGERVAGGVVVVVVGDEQVAAVGK